MADVDNEKSVVDSATEDIEQAAKKVNSSAKTVKAVSSAAAHAAAGDVAGAALELLKDEETRKRVVAIVLVSAFMSVMLICAFFAVPISIYEGIQGYFETVKDRWDEVYYSGDSGRVESLLRATVSGVVDTIQDIWAFVTGSSSNNNESERDMDIYESSDLTLLGMKESMAEVMLRKILACNDKLEARTEMIEDAIEASARSGAINRYFQNRFLQDKQAYADDPDVCEVKYGGVQIITSSLYQGTNKKIRAGEAMKLLSLYTALNGGDINSVKLSAFMKWLGYYDEFDSQQMYFTVGDAVTLSVKGWKGDFMPKYLVQEASDNPDGDYSAYKCSAIDMLLRVSSPSFEDIQGIPDDSETKTVYVRVPHVPEPTPTPTPTLFNPHPTPTPTPTPTPDPGYDLVPVEKTVITIYYPIVVSVGTRSVESIVDLAGLWEGPLSESQQGKDEGSMLGQSVVDIAVTQLGNKGTTYWDWYGDARHGDWCAMFVSWCADQGGYIEAGVVPKMSSPGMGISWFVNRDLWQGRSYVPSPGDIIFFNGENGVPVHVGIVEHVEGNTVYTVEGNAGYSVGGEVAAASYTIGEGRIYGYGTPLY